MTNQRLKHILLELYESTKKNVIEDLWKSILVSYVPNYTWTWIYGHGRCPKTSILALEYSSLTLAGSCEATSGSQTVWSNFLRILSRQSDILVKWQSKAWDNFRLSLANIARSTSDAGSDVNRALSWLVGKIVGAVHSAYAYQSSLWSIRCEVNPNQEQEPETRELILRA